MLPEDHPDHSYNYLVESIEKHLQQKRSATNLARITKALHPKPKGDNTNTGNQRNNKGIKALAAAFSQQCPHWLKPTGCRDPSNCKLGKHDNEFKGLAAHTFQPSGKGGGKSTKAPGPPPPPKKGAPKGDGKGKKGKAAKGGQGQSAKLPDDALVDHQGRRPCYPYMRGQCTLGDACTWAHCQETPAMAQ